MKVKFIDLQFDGGGRYYRLRFKRPAGLDIHSPAQYVELTLPPYYDGQSDKHIPETSQFCVIAGNTDKELHFMVQRHSEFCQSLLGWTKFNDEVEMSKPKGGFDLSDARGRTVICFAGGSGIAAIMPILEDLNTNRDAMNVDVFYSESGDTFAFNDELDGMPCTINRFVTENAMSSNPQEPILGMIAKLSGQAPVKFPNRPLVYVCGGREYAERLKEALVPVHVRAEDFRLNF